ncbi:MAG TPA: SDR family oxidoreductase [Kiritimatiellia bacterium]|nr:SDR family oxidoreductase [Kiritimatiellia bacterium]HMO98322.1 SDR family oxidoreductase [Kiritimatiellia bacterium]
MKTCLVIGAKGFIGSAILAEANRRGYDTLGIDLDNIEAHRGASADLMINAAGNARKFIDDQNPRQGFDLSVSAVMQLLQDFKATRLVHLSSGAIYPDEGHPENNHEDTSLRPEAMTHYGFHKWLAEHVVRHWHPEALVVRMGGFVGPGLKKNAIYDLLSGGPLFVHPDSAFQFLDTRDLARLVFDLCEGAAANARLLNLSARGVITVREAAALAGRDVPEEAFTRPVIRAELNVAKAAALIPLPETAVTVQQFIKDVQQGTLTLP